MEKGDGDNNNNGGVIRWAKRKITGSIIWRMLPTPTTTTTGNNNNSNLNSNSNKRQKIIGQDSFDDDDLNDNANNKLLVTLLFSSGLPLTKLMSYLEPYDILNCIQTCKKWNIDIDKDEIWYEVAKQQSSSFPSRNCPLDAIINSINNNTQEEDEDENKNDDATTTTTTTAAATAAAAAEKSNSNSKSNPNSNSNSNTSNSSINSELNYRNIAIAMSRKMNDYEEVIPPKIFPKSTLNLKDVLVVIEIRDKLVVNDDIDDDDNNNDNNDTSNNNTNTNTNTNTNNSNNNNYRQLGTFCSNLTEWTEDKPGHSKYISYDSNSISKKDSSSTNCFSNIILQTDIENDDDGCEVACTNFEMSSRLIRHDTGQCIVLNDYEGIQYYKGDKEGCFMTDKELKPKANGRSSSRNTDNNLSAGTIARDVCYHYNYSHIGFDLDFIMERLSDYEYKIKSFQFKLTVSKGDGSGGGNDGDVDDGDNGDDDDDDANIYKEEFNSMNHFLLFLEGLDWK